MLNKEKIENFWKSRSEIKDPRLATRFKDNNALNYDLDFILKYVRLQDQILDLGCGTGAITNALEPHVKKIMAVDKNPNFLKFCKDSEKIMKKTADLPNYVDTNQYDLILLFGVLNYLNDIEVSQLYKVCHGLLKEKGKLLIKHTCGINQNVLIDGHSEILGQHYHALYRSLANERNLIMEFFPKYSVVDIYPDYLNPWENTHFYAFVVEK